jgi:glutathione S-transferase
MGDTFTVPDLLLGHCAGWAKAFGWTVPDGNVTDYFARIAARPAYLAAKARREAS